MAQDETRPRAPKQRTARTLAAAIPASLAPARESQITLRDKGDILDMVAAAGTRQLHPMRGFDPDYTDIVDYIVRITHKIWEEKAIGLIYDTYGHNISVWTTDGLTKGREAIVANTLRALAANPHVKIYVDEVIWSGNEDDGFHTSMRYASVCDNTGHSGYGPPTYRRFVSRGIANCYVKENRIIEEWTVRDGLSVMHQLGHDPFVAAARAAQASAGSTPPRRTGESERVVGQLIPAAYPPKRGNAFDVEDFLRRATHEIWNWRLLNKVNDYYAANVLCHTSPAKELYGVGDLKVHILDLLGMFPDATMSVDHVYWMTDATQGEYRSAMRWTLTGTHDGAGAYGPPTGRRVHLMGITQQRIRDGKIVEEWAIYDEFALLKQLVVV